MAGFLDQPDWTLPDLVTAAWDAGRRIDLTNIGYGRIHWGDQKTKSSSPNNYYYFLAGLAATGEVQRVLEIGTHSGGATRAIHKGMQPSPDRRIVTVDITRESDEYLKDYPDIVKITGDANDMPSIVGVLAALGERRKIDLLFIDADHTYLSTTLNYAIYTTLLRPGIVVVDDVNLNDEMIACWKTIRAQAPEEHSANVEAQLPDVREASAGFGLQVLARNIGGEVDPVPIRAPNFLKSQIKKTWKLLISGRYQ